MKQITIEQLQANQFYWARRKQALGAPIPELEIIRISTVFGMAPEFWTVSVSGSDEHFDLEAYEYLHKVASPSQATGSRSNLALVSSLPRTIGHRSN